LIEWITSRWFGFGFDGIEYFRLVNALFFQQGFFFSCGLVC
jgi:hypothetical protein